jgi:hypothetical protein
MKPRASNPATQKRGTQNRSAFINCVLGKQKKENYEHYIRLLVFVVSLCFLVATPYHHDTV